MHRLAQLCVGCFVVLLLSFGHCCCCLFCPSKPNYSEHLMCSALRSHVTLESVSLSVMTNMQRESKRSPPHKDSMAVSLLHPLCGRLMPLSTQIKTHHPSLLLALSFPSHHLPLRALLTTVCLLVCPAEARHEGEGQETLLQGHCQRQGDAAHRGLCGLPVGRTTQPALYRPHRELVGVMGQQHGGEGQMVLPSRGDQAGEAAV